MNTEARIQAFNDANRPFYIVAHDDGKFSLCLPLDFLSEDFDLYCQSAFDAYAAEIGDPPLTEHGRTEVLAQGRIRGDENRCPSHACQAEAVLPMGYSV